MLVVVYVLQSVLFMLLVCTRPFSNVGALLRCLIVVEFTWFSQYETHRFDENKTKIRQTVGSEINDCPHRTKIRASKRP